jgi:hypothetical protein
MITWLYHHRNSVATFVVIWPYIIAVTLVATLRNVDGGAWPVVKDFTISTRGTSADGKLIIAGYMVNTRACRLITVEGEILTTDGNNIFTGIKFLDSASDVVYPHPKGSHKWGNWVISTPPDAVELTLYSRHECHPLWITRTKLTTIKVHEGVS